MSSVQDGSVDRNPTFCLSPTNKRKITTNLKTKKQPELPEIQTAWKSENQGVKETFIRIGRSDRDGQPGRRGCAARQWLSGRPWVRQWLVNQSVPHFR